MFAGLRRRREAIRERETERDRLAEGWTPSRSRMNCNRRGDRGAPPLKRLSARAGRRAQATMSALITNFVFVIFQFLAAAAPLKRRPALQQEYFP